jgi:DNA-binding NarL/FixJ family response regulator
MKRILIIEDQPQMRKNLMTILEMENFEVTAAENGRRGVELAKETPPDLVICDVMMPELDGYGVLQQLRQHKATANVPFIFLTAKGEKTDLRAGMNLGADDYLTKPVAKADLLGTIAARLERQRAHEQTLQEHIDNIDLKPNFDSPQPLEALGLTPREAEVLLWVAQGKSNYDIAVILGMSEKTAKKHLGNIFEKLGLESRNAAALQAVELLRKPAAKTPPRSEMARSLGGTT